MIREWYTTQLPRIAEWFGKRTTDPARSADAPPAPNASAPFAARVDPNWSPEWIRRTLTDEPGKGMGPPFSNANAELFLRACGLSRSTVVGEFTDPENAALLHRMWDRVVAHDR